jgi:hypothetical protein
VDVIESGLCPRFVGVEPYDFATRMLADKDVIKIGYL